MNSTGTVSRRAFLASAPVLAGLARPSAPGMAALRREIVESPVGVALHRARVFTRVFRANEDKPWIERKAMAMREYFRTVPLYRREHDRIAGSITETPGAMPLIVEVGIGENSIYTGENPKRKGYFKGQVPAEIWDYWLERNLWGRFRAANPGAQAPRGPDAGANYKFICNQGHLSPSYGELLRVGIGGLIKKVAARRSGEKDPEKLAFLNAADHSLEGLREWARRYGEFLGRQAALRDDARLAAELREMSDIAWKVSEEPPATFREALQLIWFAHQAVHIEGHGYSCTPDHIDQLLYPYYAADRKAGRIDDRETLALCENLVLKMYDNTFWGPEHHLTQGLCLGGSTPEGKDLANRLSWLFLEGGTNLALPEPLIWIRWHKNIDQEFFDFALSRIARHTCFPLMWNDEAVPAGLMELGVSREDACNYIAVGCNELAIPGQFYFNPAAHVNYLGSIQKALESAAPAFDGFAAAFGKQLRASIRTRSLTA
ncbi:MAG: pyruvate formate lyase family protein [Acidobacteria bacterium]|nr:pyruvate formate lyase family protein [Acidobacteriota bacterium]